MPFQEKEVKDKEGTEVRRSENNRPRVDLTPTQYLGIAQKAGPLSRSAEAACPHVATAKAGNLAFSCHFHLTFVDFSFNGILHLTEVELFVLISHSKAAGLQSQLFVSVEGEPF